MTCGEQSFVMSLGVLNISTSVTDRQTENRHSIYDCANSVHAMRRASKTSEKADLV